MGSTPVERKELNIREKGINNDEEVFLHMEAGIESEPADLSEGMQDRRLDLSLAFL